MNFQVPSTDSIFCCLNKGYHIPKGAALLQTHQQLLKALSKRHRRVSAPRCCKCPPHHSPLLSCTQKSLTKQISSTHKHAKKSPLKAEGKCENTYSKEMLRKEKTTCILVLKSTKTPKKVVGWGKSSIWKLRWNSLNRSFWNYYTCIQAVSCMVLPKVLFPSPAVFPGKGKGKDRFKCLPHPSSSDSFNAEKGDALGTLPKFALKDTSFLSAHSR